MNFTSSRRTLVDDATSTNTEPTRVRFLFPFSFSLRSSTSPDFHRSRTTTTAAFLRATSPNPDGPFEFQEEVLPPFHHGAHLVKLPDQTFAIFGDGINTPESVVKFCAPNVRGRRLLNWLWESVMADDPINFDEHDFEAVVDASSEEEFEYDDEDDEDDFQGERRNLRRRRRKKPKGNGGLYKLGSAPNDILMVAHSESITGPWKQLEIMRTDMKRFNKWDCNVTNPAPVVLPNNTIVMGFRSKSCVPMGKQKCGRDCQRIGIMVSHNGWEGPFVKRGKPITELNGNEDPTMWKSKRGWHMIMHSKTACGLNQRAVNNCGSMGYSPDSYTWYQSPWPVYTGAHFQWSNGKADKFTLRHRPKMMIDDATGQPMYLYNAVRRPGIREVHNIAFPFNTPVVRAQIWKPKRCPSVKALNTCSTLKRGQCKVWRKECEWCGGRAGSCKPRFPGVCRFGLEEQIKAWQYCPGGDALKWKRSSDF